MATASLARASRSSERRFFVGMTVAMLVAILVGFARSFFLRPLFPAWPSPSEPVFYVHGALFSIWCVLLVVQPSLVATGRTALHRRVGVWGVALAAAMVLVGVYVALVAAARPTGFTGVPVPPLQFLAIPMMDMVLFAAYVALAVVKRRDLQAHKRWMLLASMNLLTAGFARWPVLATMPVLVPFAVTMSFWVSLIAWDVRSRGRIHPATLWGGLVLLLSVPARLLISGTAPWIAFAGWMVAQLR
ncbi:MAG: hypothetical protein IT184_12225 [Acidobacteria bacterium]|nr:hypothetical protein [Acidobacteriota bacterium]